MLSGTYDVLKTLTDGKWHSVYELNDKHGWKCISRVSDLIKKGCVIDKRQFEEGKPEKEYRLVTAPEFLLEKIKFTRNDKFDHLLKPTLF